MATLEELSDALMNAHKAGDTAAAKQLADAIVAMRAAPAQPSAPEPQERSWLRAVGDFVGNPLDAPRQIGLTARYGLEGLGQAAQIVTEPIRYVTDRLTGSTGKTRPAGVLASDLADTLGLPKPADANERVIGDAARLVAGGGGMLGAAGAAARAGGTMQAVGQTLAANPVQQLISAGGAGLAGGAAREGGGSDGVQAAAALVGGLAAPAAAAGVDRGARALRNLVTPPRMENVDQRIELILRSQGVDWKGIGERARQALRIEVAQAMRTGRDLDPAAVRRLADFAQVPGVTPTRGALTLDPVQITRERNLAKMGANSGDPGLQRLAQAEQTNNAALIEALNSAGARNAPDAFATGSTVLGALNNNIERSKSTIGRLYDRARDSAGRSAPLDGATFSARANTLIDDAMVGGALPPAVAERMNQIARGEVPFTVDFAEQFKTQIGKLQRSTSDGQARYALGLVRQALDETPVVGLGRQGPAAGARTVNPGNLPAIPGETSLGQDAISAFNRARRANRAFMSRVENTPALAAAMDGAQPDQFVQRFITGQGATVKDVRALRRAVSSDPATLQAVRGQIVDHLKRQALSGAADETGNFSQAAYNRAFNAIGERKLSAFFEPAEIEQLKAVGKVASYLQAQPRGSAVNNSNSGALVLGRGIDMMGGLTSKLPLGLNTTITGLLQGGQQRSALNVPPSLLAPQVATPAMQRLLMPGIASGLFATQVVPQGEDR